MRRVNDSWDAAREDYLKDRSRSSPWDARILLLILPLAVIGLLGVLMLVLLTIVKGEGRTIPQSTAHRYQRQVVGQPLAWRTLADFSNRGIRINAMAYGNFDQDPDPELALSTPGYGIFLVELDGSMRKLSGFPVRYTSYLLAWDWDADGTDELVLDDPGGASGVAVYDLSGKQLHQFNSMHPVGFSIKGDYDGDGFDELLLLDYSGLTATVYAAQGKQLETAVTSGQFSASLLADVDNDGKAELVVCDGQKYSIYEDGQAEKTPCWPAPAAGEYLSMAVDLTGDGKPELIDPLHSILDTTSKSVPLQFGNQGGALCQSGWLATTVFDDPQAQKPRLVVIPDSIQGSSIYMFDAAGTLVYKMMLMPGAVDCYNLEYQGQQRLVVATSEKVMIYP